MTDLDASLVAQQVLDVAERQRAADLQHHCQADDLWAGLEVAERGAPCHLTKPGDKVSSFKESALTVPAYEPGSSALQLIYPRLYA